MSAKTGDQMTHTSTYESPIGLLYLSASQKGISQISIEKITHLKSNQSSKHLSDGKFALDRFFKCQNFELPSLDWNLCTMFQKKVLKQLCQVKVGKTLSYGELAEQINSPKAARAVGSCMRFNPWPLLVPCHRIIPASGAWGNYSLGGPDTKASLLEMEKTLNQSEI